MSDRDTATAERPRLAAVAQAQSAGINPVRADLIKAAEDLVRDGAYVAGTIARGEIPRLAPDAVSTDDIEIINLVSHAFAQGEDAFRGGGAAVETFAKQVSQLESALMRVVRAISPVTVTSLRDTDPKDKSAWALGRTYRANQLSTGLIVATVLFVLVSLAGEVWVRFVGEPLDQTEGWDNFIGIAFESITPFVYGSIGACVYLLRALHGYIYQRTFDRRRVPEYLNRIILGSVSGGAIVLLIDELGGDGGEAIHLSSAALGFVVGYNTDLLFSAIERVSQAILPKVEWETAKQKDAKAAKAVAAKAPETPVQPAAPKTRSDKNADVAPVEERKP